MEPVSSTRNQHVVRVGRLQRARTRRQLGATVLEGPHILDEAVAAGATLTEVFGLTDDEDARRIADAAGARWIPVTRQVLERIAETENPRGPIGVMQIPAETAPEGDCIWLATADPGNTGTLIRTAAAFGFSVIVDSAAADPWAPKVIRAAAGGHFRARISHGRPSGGAFTIATTMTGSVSLDELAARLPASEPVCLLIGNEAHGLDEATTQRADLTVAIPMPGGIESLNAGVAGALCMYEVMLGRRSTQRRAR